ESIAASDPVAPIAIPMSEAASAGASLMPSPIIATEPFLVSSAIAAALSSGRSSARTSSIPARFARALAVRACAGVGVVPSWPAGAGVVSGEHGHLEALGSEGAHDFGDLGAQLVTHADRGDRLPLAVHDHDGHALLL